jgi:hypothetical protein
MIVHGTICSNQLSNSLGVNAMWDAKKKISLYNLLL